MSVHVVTDSTSDLDAEAAAALGITVVPLTLHFGDEELRDGVDIDSATFYDRLARGGVQPSTSQPSPERFAEAYRSLLASDDARVVSIHISSHWSGTVQSASLAAKDFDGRVAVVDSLTVSSGMQFLLRAAAADAASGADLESVVRGVEEGRGRVHVYVLLDTLTYLQRGGRIGRAQAFVGGVLKVKPLLRLDGGEVHPLTRVRNAQQGVARLVEVLAANGPLADVALMVGGTPALGAEARRRLGAAYPELEVRVGKLGPVVGTYAGPGAIGVAGLRAPA